VFAPLGWKDVYQFVDRFDDLLPKGGVCCHACGEACGKRHYISNKWTMFNMCSRCYDQESH
jgi:hypothetical protein